ncbi:LysR family transcriptional regulator [Serinicoccus kebangsaanensis]|uniref:LysR family transcriptional regulator n=1 Tax=Serinicoccus kebangsaanensis TaxID=2602069 RepID=UPI00178C2FD5|nr:LysR substrate-binding domain-containing protein [Serinicoccus kebangsaanensis]
MELRRLRLLAELEHRGTIAAVAEALSFSPSSVSVQLAELEREAGSVILQRVGRGVQLTAAGRLLAQHAREALSADEAVRAEMAATAERPGGRLRIAVVQTAALALVPPVLAGLARSAPELRVEVVGRETEAALDELRARGLDLVVGIDYEPVPTSRHRDVHRTDLLQEDVLVAVPARTRPRLGVPIDVRTLESAAWAASRPGSGHSAAVEYVCARHGGFAPDIRHRTDDSLILRALVSSGHAVTLLPALIGTATPQVAVRPVEGTPLVRTIFSATREALRGSPGVEAVRAALHQAAQVVTQDRTDVRAL